MEITAFILSILAFCLSVVQFIRNSSRQKKESTLTAYNEMQNEVFGKLNRWFGKEENDISTVEFKSEDWEELTEYLAKMERFAVGVNTGIFSVRVLNRLGGGYMIRMFNNLKPLIDRKREQNNSAGGHYNELETMVLKLQKMRKK